MRWHLPVRRCRLVPFQDQAAVERVRAYHRRAFLVRVEHPAVVECEDFPAWGNVLNKRCRRVMACEARHQIVLFILRP
jgi:hypothetical protein